MAGRPICGEILWLPGDPNWPCICRLEPNHEEPQHECGICCGRYEDEPEPDPTLFDEVET